MNQIYANSTGWQGEIPQPKGLPTSPAELPGGWSHEPLGKWDGSPRKRQYFSRPMSDDTPILIAQGYCLCFSPPRIPTISMILGGAIKGVAQPHSRRVGIAMQNVDQLLWICQILQFQCDILQFQCDILQFQCVCIFFAKRVWTVTKHWVGPSNQYIFCFSLTTTIHLFFEPSQQRIVLLSPLDWDLCCFLLQKKGLNSVFTQCRSSHQIYTLNFQTSWKEQNHFLVKNASLLARKAFTCA